MSSERADIVPIPQLHYHTHPKKPQPAGEGWRFRFTSPEPRVWTPANCHFDSLNLVRNSNLEFEFMHEIRATEGAQLERPGPILGFYQLVLGRK